MDKNHHFLDELAQKVSKLMPAGVKELSRDFEKNVKQLLHTSFHKLELVTRKEFDIQARVLIQTRGKLDKLERKLAELEEKLKKKSQK